MKIFKDTPFEFGYLVWQISPGRHVMVVAIKATFAIADSAPCTIAEKQQLVTGEVPFDDEDEASIRLDTDLAVHKPRGECFLAGTCYPPGGPATVSAVSFQVGTVKKSLAVIGDRYWSGGRLTGGVMSSPMPFTSMQLRYERSFGGPGFDKNPVGMGIASVETPEGPRRPLPNIENRQALITSPDARPDPAGAFPIPRTWATRMKQTGTYDSAWFRKRWPYFPDDFDWAYFNAAPVDQQIEQFWRGDEEIQLQNLNPSLSMIRTRLPSLRARCFVERLDGTTAAFHEAPLHLDTITVDADAMSVFCVWRGIVDVRDDSLDDVSRVFVMHESLGPGATLEECRARFERAVRAVSDEDAEFAPETVVPDGPKPKPRERAAPPAESPMPLDLAAELAAAGIVLPVAEPAPAAPTAEEIESLKAAMRKAGQEVPPGLDQLLEPLPPPPVRPPPAAPPSDLRTQVLERRARGEDLEGMDLTNADLSSLDLRGVNLANAVLQGAKLVETRFDGAKLDGAQLGGAHLAVAVFYGASLVGADLTAVTGAQVNFDTAVMTDAVLERAQIPRSAFRGTDMTKVDLVSADCSGSTFEGAMLNEADLSLSNLDDAVFTGASLVSATLEHASAARAVFDGCNLTGLRASGKTQCVDAKFRRVAAAGSHWAGARLDKSDFSFSNLEAADFSKTSLVQSVLNGCNIKNGKFASAVMVGAALVESDLFAGLFESADLSHADARGSNFFGAEFWKAKTENMRLELANLKRTKLQGRT